VLIKTEDLAALVEGAEVGKLRAHRAQRTRTALARKDAK
jgi:hypothetical protein